MDMKLDIHATAARVLIIAASAWTAGLQLWAPSSLAYRAAGDSMLIDAMNWVVLALAGVAVADVVWCGILRRGLILPRIPTLTRHHLCVALYSALAGAFAVRAFIATGDPRAALPVGAYYVLVAAGIAIEAAAIAHEQRDPPCRPPCDSA
jgi:hypothetical protein